jgi:GT2 family glycosyltransferase
MPARPSTAVIIPASDQPATLDRCLAAIRGSDQPPEEIVVVTDATLPGPAAARNAGAARARSDVLAFVDADVVVRHDVFTRIRDSFAADDGLTALFGSYDDEPEAPDAVSGFRNLLHHHVHHSAPGRASTFWAGIGAVRREAFEAAGGFDAERFPQSSIEDVELGMRLAAAGARIELDPRIEGTHLKRWTLMAMVRTDFARRGMPWARLLIERRELSGELNLGWRHRVSTLVAILVLAAIARGRMRGAAAALLALIAVNRSFYALLLRRRGPAQAASAVALHLVHHAVAAVSVAAGLAAEVMDRRPQATGG